MNTTSPAPAAVSVRDLQIRYGAATVIDGLNIDVAAREFLVLLGPSGCGKSTLLNAIAGLNDIAGGQIHISGKNVTWAEPKDRGIGMVFQSYALYPRMSVEKNLTFGLRVAGVPKDEIARRLAHASKLLHLDDLLQRKPAELSGGQRQRVAIGRALVREVDVFLFDEPLSNLDAKLRTELRVEIKKLHQDLGNTMIYVTHDQTEAMTLADRIAIMRGGVIQQLATPAEVYHRPANLFVAGFIGAPAMNFIPGTLTADGAFTGGGVVLPAVAAGASGTATLGIRPEHITPVPVGTGALRGTVTVVEPMGADTVVWFDCAGQQMSLRVMGDTTLTPGTEIGAAFDPARASLFDAQGDRI
ncbi:iron(III) transport system ATP-binding protein (plasmid) [Ketogulonicigenium robustum]|uniref:Iron(III) transport system ATP-binding protein n=1 Tax=Ketogulonicigenium robustum TaxID=92947 RepID=A0A1W6P3L2_9RHOB|nr:ABC transporter ATP-binding protein [Ketogulonicigenium robustum]ARO15940.1 iron(III) transport system ATP-binding protein [Ketogulonicigenium robustum]